MFANDVTNKGLNSKIYKQIMCSKLLEQTTQLMGRRSKYTFLFFFNFYYYLEYNCFTMLCWFLPCINMSPSWVYIRPLPHEHPSYILPTPHPVLLSRLSQSTGPRSLRPTADPHWPSVFARGNAHVSVALSQFTPPSPFPAASTSLLSMSASLLLPPK